MKKAYMKPEVLVQEIELESLVCLSIVEGNADSSAVLVKERGSRAETEVDETAEILQDVEAQPEYGNLW